MLIIDQNSNNILLIYKGLYSTHGIIFDCLHILLLFNAILRGKKMKKKTVLVSKFQKIWSSKYASSLLRESFPFPHLLSPLS